MSRVPINGRCNPGPPKTIVQFWHDLGELPEDIAECIASWAWWSKSGFTHYLFDEHRAEAFIADSLDARHERAFDRSATTSRREQWSIQPTPFVLVLTNLVGSSPSITIHLLPAGDIQSSSVRSSGRLSFSNLPAKACFQNTDDDRTGKSIGVNFASSAPGGMEGELVVLRDWESFAVSRWPLSYRSDARNWRFSNQQRFRRERK